MLVPVLHQIRSYIRKVKYFFIRKYSILEMQKSEFLKFRQFENRQRRKYDLQF